MLNRKSIAALLLTLAGLGHVYVYWAMSPDNVLLVIIGVIYTIIGVGIFLNVKGTLYAGAIAPPIGITSAILGTLLFSLPEVPGGLIFLVVEAIAVTLCVLEIRSQ